MWTLRDHRALATFAEIAYAKNLVSFQIMHPHKTLQIHQLSTPKNSSKDTLKPEMQREWTHPLHKCRIKKTMLCGKAAEMHVPGPPWPPPPQLFLVPPPLQLICKLVAKYLDLNRVAKASFVCKKRSCTKKITNDCAIKRLDSTP